MNAVAKLIANLLRLTTTVTVNEKNISDTVYMSGLTVSDLSCAYVDLDGHREVTITPDTQVITLKTRSNGKFQITVTEVP